MDVASVSAPPAISSPPGAGAQASVQTPPASPPAATPDVAPSSLQISEALKQVNDSFQQKGQNLYAAFEKDKSTGINVVKIVDKKTNETISQMPIKEMVAFAQSLEHPQGMRGKLINATA